MWSINCLRWFWELQQTLFLQHLENMSAVGPGRLNITPSHTDRSATYGVRASVGSHAHFNETPQATHRPQIRVQFFFAPFFFFCSLFFFLSLRGLRGETANLAAAACTQRGWHAPSYETSWKVPRSKTAARHKFSGRRRPGHDASPARLNYFISSLTGSKLYTIAQCTII